MPMLKRLSILLIILTLLTTSAQAYYDPYVGRFTQRDPIGDGSNWYAYVANNPMKYTDPTGMVIKLVDGNQSITVSSLTDLRNLSSQNQSGEMADLINIFTDNTDNAALAHSSSLDLRTSLTATLESSVVTTIKFADLQANIDAGKTVAYGETIPTTVGNDVDSIVIHIDRSALGDRNDPVMGRTLIPRLRKTTVHELSHAGNMITTPALANTDNVGNQFTLEKKAYDLGERWRRTITGRHAGFYSPNDARLRSVTPGTPAYNKIMSELAHDTVYGGP